MLRSLWNGATGMNAQTQKIDTIANNISNVNTVGYKRNQANFQDLVYQAINQVGNPVNLKPLDGNVIQSGVGVKLATNNKIFSQGGLNQTDRGLDLAIQGDGFFAVWLENGERAYTRDGAFQLNAEGEITNIMGKLQLPEGIKVPEDTKELAVANNGQITVTKSNGETQIIGNLQLYRFENPAGMQSIGQNMYKATDQSGTAIEENAGNPSVGIIKQGFLEHSNVDLSQELTQLIEAQRAYELNSRSLKTADEMWSMANSIKR